MTSQTFDAYPVRILWWAADGSVEERFCTSLVSLDERPDEVLLDDHGRVLAQASIERLRARTAERGHALVDDLPPPDDIDVFGARSRIKERPTLADCRALDDALNLLIEVGRSTGRPMNLSGNTADHVTDKIFWGTGVLRPPSEPPWRPRLSRRERRKLHQVLGRGISHLSRVIGSVGDVRFDRLTAAVNAEDPVGLIADGCPYDEYGPEVEEIAALGATATATAVQDVLDRWFDGKHALTRAGAERIAAATRRG